MFQLLLFCAPNPDQIFQTIATGTSSNKRVYYVSNFTELAAITNELKTDVISYALEGKSVGVRAPVLRVMFLVRLILSPHVRS